LRVSKIAKRYAKALLDVGKEDGNYERYGSELKEFAKICSDNPEFFNILSSPVFSLEERMKILDDVLAKAGFSEVINNFLRILMERKRINRVLEIAEYYSFLLDEFLGIARAKIITAKPIKKKTMEKLIAALEKFTSKKVEAETEIDESIIGGVVVKIGNLILDGSIVAQLEGLKESLKRSGWG